MIVIGEKINGFIPSTAKAIAGRDEAYIRMLAEKQTEFGAHYIDVCAGTGPEVERETLEWLIGLVQDTVDTPICIDSSDCNVILEMLPLVKEIGMINSVSDEHGKCELIFPKVADTAWNIVALTCDQRGISNDPDIKFEIAGNIIEKARGYGIADDRLFIDPLVTTLSTTQDSLIAFTAAVRMIKDKYPDVHITSGLSNISFGMPYRQAINRQFLALAMAAGMDSAIMDPLSADMRSTLYATQALLGLDEFCMEYLTAYRRGLIGAKPAK
jgi:5-methyltetrahydrofolate--homocysteine methyltransferase